MNEVKRCDDFSAGIVAECPTPPSESPPTEVQVWNHPAECSPRSLLAYSFLQTLTSLRRDWATLREFIAKARTANDEGTLRWAQTAGSSGPCQSFVPCRASRGTAVSSHTQPAVDSHTHDARTLGEIKVEAFEQDVLINDRSQTFSAELLRLALLGVGGVGYVAARALTSESPAVALRMGAASKWLVLFAAASFGLCAASALCLRYLSSELIAFQLRIVRLRIRGTVHDGNEADGEESRRNRRLKVMRPMLLVSSGALAAGAGVFIAFLFVVLRP